jgi:DNA-binding Lrp family transcriptional regulator
MVELDDTDTEILRLLMEDARRSYTDIGEQVGLSPPSVSKRVSHLQQLGVIQDFTLNIDRSMLTTGDAVLIEIEAKPGKEEPIVDALTGVDSVQYIVQAIDPRITVHAYMDDRELNHLFSEVLDVGDVAGYEVRKVTNSVWSPQISRSDLAITCVECEKPILDEGVTVTVEEQRYYLCCPSCESIFRDRYEELQAASDDH